MEGIMRRNSCEHGRTNKKKSSLPIGVGRFFYGTWLILKLEAFILGKKDAGICLL